MANTISDKVMRIEPAEMAPVRRSSWTRWPKRILLFLVFIWLAGVASSFLIQHTRLHGKITARLESVFGRPVEVGRYDFSLWGWPTLAAESITVGEDPRFGYEYFLRAESLTVRLRWPSLLRGRLEFGTLSLDRPSLNLVRNTEGDWNLAEWLPRPTSTAITPIGPQRPPSSPLRFTRIEVNSGRINFKRNEEKIPFAFTDVNGFLEPEGPGRWRFDLEAIPSRAAVVLQKAGMLHLSGHLGGTSSRLRPAALDLSWTSASISDLLRLARSYDYGVRGTFALALHAQTDADAWVVEGRTELRQIHRWDLPLRADNPAVNLIAKMRWYPLDSGLDLEDASLEAPHSHASLRAAISWGDRRIPRAQQPPPFRVQVQSSAIDLGDLLAWLRAFHPGVADDVSIHGFLNASGLVAGWPLHVENASIESPSVANARSEGTRNENDTAELTAAGLPAPVRLSEISLRYDRGLDYLSPLTLSFGAADGSLRLEAIRKPRTNTLSDLRLTGSLRQVRDVIAAAAALGWNISRGWDLAGPARCDLRWDAAPLSWPAQPSGTIDWGAEQTGGSLLAPFLNRPFEQIRAHAELKPGARHVTLSSAAAFGAHWNGTFDRRGSDSAWQFALSADHLAAADLDRWLNPRWRQSLFDRVLPFLSSRSAPIAIPENLSARGKITMDQFSIAPLGLHHLQGDLKLEGRRIELANAKAQFYGGELDGTFRAELAPVPAYHAHLDFTRVDLAALTAAAPSLANLFAGSATGNLSLDTHGTNRDDLLAALACGGSATVSRVQLRGIDLQEPIREGSPRPGSSNFLQAVSNFTCAARTVHFKTLQLGNVDTGVNLSGTVDFNRNLDLRLTPLHPNYEPKGPAYRLTGPLAAPEIARATAPAARP
jgi:AsmA-like protein